MFKELDLTLHLQLRLAVMSLLITVKEAECFLTEKTGVSIANPSVQIQKLKEADYIDVKNNSRTSIRKPLAP